MVGCEKAFEHYLRKDESHLKVRNRGAIQGTMQGQPVELFMD